ADPALLRAAVRGHAAAVLRRRLRRRLPRPLAAARAHVHGRGAAPLPPRRPPLGALPVPLLARVPRAAVLRDGGRRASVAMNRRLAHKNIRTGLIVWAICMFMFGITFLVAAVYVS